VDRKPHVDWQEDLKARFIAAIGKAFPAPTPLIGDKWFVFPPGGKPADFQFLGVRKLAKFVARNLDLSGLDCRVAIEEEWKIHLWRLPPGSGARNEALPTHAPATAQPGSAAQAHAEPAKPENA
jgi:hypothetical protein